MNLNEAKHWVKVKELDWLEFVKDFGIKDEYNHYAVTVWINIQLRII